MHRQRGRVHRGVLRQLGDQLLHDAVDGHLDEVVRHLPPGRLRLLLLVRAGEAVAEQPLAVALQGLVHQVAGDLVGDVLDVVTVQSRRRRRRLGERVGKGLEGGLMVVGRGQEEDGAAGRQEALVWLLLLLWKNEVLLL